MRKANAQISCAIDLTDQCCAIDLTDQCCAIDLTDQCCAIDLTDQCLWFLLPRYENYRGQIKVPFQGGASDVVSVSCFGVRVSVMFHFMFVHYTFSSVWVAEWPPFGK